MMKLIVLVCLAGWLTSQSESGDFQRVALNSPGVAETDAHAPRAERSEQRAKISNGQFAVVTVALTDRRWAAIRYHRATGKCWKLKSGVWIPVRELEQLRPEGRSRFEVQAVCTDKGRFAALRLDRRSGQCWELVEDTWHPILDREE
ncbi:MAG: hypothetical protein R3C19_11105 [Planctomycetaceae bacterium]